MYQVNSYLIETIHGVLVDTKPDAKSALATAERRNKFPLFGNTPLRVYYCNGKGEKVYLK